VVDSKCLGDKFIAEKYKILQSNKRGFIRNSSLVQIYLSARDCKCVGNIPRSLFGSEFAFLTMSVSFTMLISVQGTHKN